MPYLATSSISTSMVDFLSTFYSFSALISFQARLSRDTYNQVSRPSVSSQRYHSRAVLALRQIGEANVSPVRSTTPRRRPTTAHGGLAARLFAPLTRREPHPGNVSSSEAAASSRALLLFCLDGARGGRRPLPLRLRAGTSNIIPRAAGVHRRYRDHVGLSRHITRRRTRCPIIDPGFRPLCDGILFVAVPMLNGLPRRRRHQVFSANNTTPPASIPWRNCCPACRARLHRPVVHAQRLPVRISARASSSPPYPARG